MGELGSSSRKRYTTLQLARLTLVYPRAFIKLSYTLAEPVQAAVPEDPRVALPFALLPTDCHITTSR